MARINTIYADRLLAVAAAIGALSKMNIAVIEVDINRVRPVITVQPCTAVNSLKGALFSRRGSATGVISRMQARLKDCRIEWEVRP
jgi:hypothetical protein